MHELPASTIQIRDAFWSPRLEVNASAAVFHQWQQLEQSGCVDNFRIAAREKEGFREGWFFADSDAFKWLDAAARVYLFTHDEKLKALMDDFIALISRAQMPDGYIYTYNQIHFPGQHWVNLQIEHELYCHGHFIEGAISHYEATGERSALDLALKAADLLVRNFLHAAPEFTDGHEEIEIALMKLSQVTGRVEYLDLAEHFIEARGRIRNYAIHIYRENTSKEARTAQVNAWRAAYIAQHPEHVSPVPPENEAKRPPFSKRRWDLSGLSGKYGQQHAPVREQTIPVGHAVRYGYFQTATTMLHRLRGDATLLPALKQSWERMVTRRMYVTGGLGSLPDMEGFGNDYELDPEYAYAETCATLASLFWNWEMALVTREAKYSDLFEWQLYNAAAVGMGLNGRAYLYNNPLTVRGGIARRAWYAVPCCPSNLSRTWAHLGKYIYSLDGNDVWIHQYISNESTLTSELTLKLDSSLPFAGDVALTLNLPTPKEFTLWLRRPSWTSSAQIQVNGETIAVPHPPQFDSTAQGYDPRPSQFIPVKRIWSAGDVVTLKFDLPITLRRAHPKVRGHAGKAALTRGPLAYCLESMDNPGVDIFTVTLDSSTLRAEHDDSLLGRITRLVGKSISGEMLTFIPYQLWGNRGASQMTVWVNVK